MLLSRLRNVHKIDQVQGATERIVEPYLTYGETMNEGSNAVIDDFWTFDSTLV